MCNKLNNYNVLTCVTFIRKDCFGYSGTFVFSGDLVDLNTEALRGQIYEGMGAGVGGLPWSEACTVRLEDQDNS